MQLPRTVLLLLVTGLYTILFVFVFITSAKVFQSLFAKTNRLKNIFSLVVCLSLLLGFEYLLPDNFAQTSYYGIYLSCGFILWLSSIDIIKQKQNFGELLFKSCRLSSKLFYITVPFIISIFAFSIVRCASIITGVTDVPQEIQDLGVNYRIYYLVLLLFALSASINFVVFSWKKLEIRQQGLVSLNSLIKWENIIAYSWAGKKQDLLEIEYKTRNEKTQKSKVAVAIDEKEKIKEIFDRKQIEQSTA